MANMGCEPMIYETLDEGLTAIDQLGTYDPQSIIKSFDIDLHDADLPDDISGFTFPLTRTIFISTCFKGVIAEIHPICHEIIHCLLDNSVEPLLDRSYVSNSKIEARANAGAFYIMVHWYLQANDIEADDFDFERFQEAFAIQPKLSYEAANVAEAVIKYKVTHV